MTSPIDKHLKRSLSCSEYQWQPASKKAAGEANSIQQRRVCGPSSIQTLRGRLLGRQVALICCGETHAEAIDLTRANCVPKPKRGWVEVLSVPDGAGLDLSHAAAVRHDVTLSVARVWAGRIVAQEEDEELAEDAWLTFELVDAETSVGTARLFRPELKLSVEHPLPSRSSVYRWADLDVKAREFNQRRLACERVPTKEYDALIAARKQSLLAERIELFDDWLIRKAGSLTEQVELILEAPVLAEEVELHVDSVVGPAPPAHNCIREIELDSGTDSDREDDPDDGTGTFLDFLRRRVDAHLPPGRVHCVDPRELGDGDHDAACDSFQKLLRNQAPPKDVECTELALHNVEEAPPPVTCGKCKESKVKMRRRRARARRPPREDGSGPLPPPVPSWEAYFGGAAELLYYSPHVKADYAPFLAKCVCSSQALRAFFEALYFGTVPDALAKLRLDAQTRPFTRIRSLVFKPLGGLPSSRRPSDDGLVPVKTAPLDMYLKARGSDPPRTWVSALAERLRRSGAGDLVEAAATWYWESVEQVLADPKEADLDGDYFVAWLRECHREVHDDVDVSDPVELRTKQWAQSDSSANSRLRRYNLQEVRIPNVDVAFAELASFDPEARISTRRERVLSKILLDVFQLRIVDLAMVLSVANLVAASTKDAHIVVVLYAGDDHVKNVTEFWRSQGFSHRGLRQKGLVSNSGKEDDEPHCFELPSYLHDLALLFPVPA